MTNKVCISFSRLGARSDSDVSELNCQRNGAAQIAGTTQGRKGSYERGSDFEHDCTHRGRSIETNSTAVPLKFLLLAHARHPALPPLLSLSPLLCSKSKAKERQAGSPLSLSSHMAPFFIYSLVPRSSKQPPQRAATLFSPTAPLSLPAGPARPS